MEINLEFHNQAIGLRLFTGYAWYEKSLTIIKHAQSFRNLSVFLGNQRYDDVKNCLFQSRFLQLKLKYCGS